MKRLLEFYFEIANPYKLEISKECDGLELNMVDRSSILKNSVFTVVDMEAYRNSKLDIIAVAIKNMKTRLDLKREVAKEIEKLQDDIEYMNEMKSKFKTPTIRSEIQDEIDSMYDKLKCLEEII